MKASSIFSACALALLAPNSALVAASSCSGGGISVSNPKVKVDSDDGSVLLTGEVTFSGNIASGEVDVDIDVFTYKVMEHISIDLCEGDTSGACPADGTYDLAMELPGNIPEEYVGYVKYIPYVSVTIYQNDVEIIDSCSIRVTSASIWNGASSFLSMGAVALAVAGGLFISRRRRTVATEDENASASFVEMVDEPTCQGVVVA